MTTTMWICTMGSMASLQQSNREGKVWTPHYRLGQQQQQVLVCRQQQPQHRAYRRLRLSRRNRTSKPPAAATVPSACKSTRRPGQFPVNNPSRRSAIDGPLRGEKRFETLSHFYTRNGKGSYFLVDRTNGGGRTSGAEAGVAKGGEHDDPSLPSLTFSPFRFFVDDAQ